MEFWQLTRNLYGLPLRAASMLLIVCTSLIATNAEGQTPNGWIAAGSGSWDTASNWSFGTVPNGSNAAVLFGGNIVSDASVSIDTPRTVKTITFNNSAHQYTLTGGSTLTLVGDAEINVPAGAHQIDAPLFAGGGLTKSGQGTLRLGGLSDVAGTTLVTAGTLQIDTNNLPGQTIQINSGAELRHTPEFSAETELRFGQTLTGAGRFVTSDLLVNPGRTLRGELTVEASNVNMKGLVAPGLPVGILTIEGDYTANEEAILEIEVGGLSPGVQHDQLVVTGYADLDGRLTVPLINGYVPSPGHTIKIIEGNNGVFAGDPIFPAVLAPNLGEVSDLSIDLRLSNNDTDVELVFVPVTSTTTFVESVATDVCWDQEGCSSQDNIWSGGSLPTTQNDVVIQNQHATDDQRVTLKFDSQDSIVHKLNLLGAGTKAMTLTLRDGGNLSVVDQVHVGDQGILEIANNGALASRLTTVDNGGTLAGDQGQIIGNVVVEAGGIVSPGRPGGTFGDEFGDINIDGDLRLRPGSQMRIEMQDNEDEHDNVNVTGQVELGGKLVFDASQFDVSDPGSSSGFENVAMFMSVESVVGQFDEVDVIAPEGSLFSFVAFENEDGTMAVGACKLSGPGDMNCDGQWDMDDVPLFAQALIDPEAFRNSCPIEGVIFCTDPPDPGDWGDVDFALGGNDGLDFDDIDDFATLVSQHANVSAGEITAAILAYGRVPEPTSFALLSCAACCFAHRIKRRRR